jgi:DNA polymerase I-like protein with 3'-5' exonuclease and polymerase domains
MYETIRPCKIEDITPETLEYIKKHHKDKRQIAKAAGFAIAFGGNGSTIAKNCNIPKKDGEFVYKSYFDSFPKMRDYFDLVFQKASHFGFIEFNLVTRRKYFFDRYSNDYFVLKDEVEDPYFWQSSSNPREIQKRYNAAKSIIQRISQNYPVQGEQNVPWLNSVNSVNPVMGIPSRAS